MKVYVIYGLLTIVICIVLYLINRKETTVIEEKKKKGDPITNAFKSFGNKMKGMMTSAIKPLLDFVNCAKIAFESIGGYFKCGFDKIVQFPTCFIFYFFDCIYGLVYVIFLIIAGILPPLKEPVDMIFNPNKGYLKMLKDLINDITKEGLGDTILYPGFIMKKCYLCDVKPFPNFSKPSQCGKKPEEKKIVPVQYTTPQKIQEEEKEDDKDNTMAMVINAIFMLILGLFMMGVIRSYVGPEELISLEAKEAALATAAASAINPAILSAVKMGGSDVLDPPPQAAAIN